MKEECTASEAKWTQDFKEQVVNWMCLFVCLLIKQDAKGLVQNEHQDHVEYDYKFFKIVY